MLDVEICVNEGGNFRKAVENAAKLTRQLMRKYNVPVYEITIKDGEGKTPFPSFLFYRFTFRFFSSFSVKSFITV